MSTYNNGNGQYMATNQIQAQVEKFVVLTTGGVFKGSWAKEGDALSFIRREIKNESKSRYLILEALKEVGTKSPEIEIEKIS